MNCYDLLRLESKVWLASSAETKSLKNRTQWEITKWIIMKSYRYWNWVDFVSFGLAFKKLQIESDDVTCVVVSSVQTKQKQICLEAMIVLLWRQTIQRYYDKVTSKITSDWKTEFEVNLASTWIRRARKGTAALIFTVFRKTPKSPISGALTSWTKISQSAWMYNKTIST